MLRQGKSLLLLALVVGVGTADAAPAWLAPQDLSAPGQNGSNPEVALDAAGNAVAVWTRPNGTNTIVQAAVRPAGGAWQSPQDLSAAGQNASLSQVAFDAAGNAVAVWERSNGTNEIVQAAVRPAGGAWQPAQDLSAAGRNAYYPQVAFDAAGNAVAVWERFNGMNYIVQAAVRTAGGPWQLPAQDLSATGMTAEDPQVALDPVGNAVAVWWRSNGTHQIVQASVRPAGGAWQLPAQDLSAAGQNASEPQVALDKAGNALAVWRRFNGTHQIVQAAVRPAGGAWQPAQDLSAAGQPASDAQVAFDPAGNAIAVWNRYDGSNYITQASVRPAGGVWQLPAKDLSEAGQHAGSPQLAFDAAGNAVAIWRRSNGTHYIAQAATRLAGGVWQLPAQDLSAVGGDAYSVQVALDPAGNALSVWQRSNGTNTIVQAAPYDAAGPVLRDIDAPTTGFARQRLSFSVDPFDVWSPLAGEPVWSFGDGKSASGRTVTHTYAKRGTYTVSVTQADAVANQTTATRLLALRTARCFGSPATKVGSSGPDRIRGTRRADVIVALGGADRVRGGRGNDKICGGNGRDRLFGEGGNDRLNGGSGRDRCVQGGGRGRQVSC